MIHVVWDLQMNSGQVVVFPLPGGIGDTSEQFLSLIAGFDPSPFKEGLSHSVSLLVPNLVCYSSISCSPRRPRQQARPSLWCSCLSRTETVRLTKSALLQIAREMVKPVPPRVPEKSVVNKHISTLRSTTLQLSFVSVIQLLFLLAKHWSPPPFHANSTL